MKHSYPGGNRVLSLLVLESAAPRNLAGSGWEDERDEDSHDRFISGTSLLTVLPRLKAVA
jgi:hypothetical protein